jgi:Na+/phosphate symporter
MKENKIEIKIDLFNVHAELMVIIGMVESVLNDINKKGHKKTSIVETFPNFIEIVNEINKKIKKYSI